MTDRAYIAQLVTQLGLASEFRIPCPGNPYGRLADLSVEKRLDGHGDGWAILRDDDAWTGTHWEHRGVLTRSEIYRYDRDTALTEAMRIAPAQTAALNALYNITEEHRRG
ncbi:hypothetical protein [Streptomyces sp. t39]|uniref:hypothetical protein n=1 Tax=Streptomyces sp. t39 TaxID=1828156 RepID=UPI0011CE91EA|nr:hypothetical protein [Streptomyces sp. t39]TXS42086.1 hypothetical protein EAO77_35595 [Streptomyces sp. t39]